MVHLFFQDMGEIRKRKGARGLARIKIMLNILSLVIFIFCGKEHSENGEKLSLPRPPPIHAYDGIPNGLWLFNGIANGSVVSSR